ncbi:MAG: zinc-binding dehydrogenase [Candidatus Hydrothermales bacterium]
MKAIVFKESIPRYVLTKILGKLNRSFYWSIFSCVRYVDIEEPKLPPGKFLKIKTTYGGICGSDINLITLKDSPLLSPYSSSPFVIGHENVGVIWELSNDVEGFAKGDRVIVDPVLSCKAKEIVNLCENCKKEEYSRCLNFAEKGKLSEGVIIGACLATGGSWGEYFIAHEFQTFKLDDDISDEEAILIDSFCSALHPVLRNFPNDNEKVLIIGAGIIGISVAIALKALKSNAKVFALCKYDFQAERIKEYAEVIYLRENYLERFAEITDSKILKPILGKKFLNSGFDLIFECTGSKDMIESSLGWTKPGGKVVLVGTSGVLSFMDMSLLWFREIKLVGTNSSSTENFLGERKRCYEIAINLIKEKKINLKDLLTHKFSLKDYGKAFETNLNKKKSKLIKSAFYFK